MAVTRAVAGLQSDPAYHQRYEVFRQDLVYGERLKFEEYLATIIALGNLLGKG